MYLFILFNMFSFSTSVSPGGGSASARSPSRTCSAAAQLFPISACHHVRSEWRAGFLRVTRPSFSFQALTSLASRPPPCFPSFNRRPSLANGLPSVWFPCSFISYPYFQFHLRLFSLFSVMLLLSPICLFSSVRIFVILFIYYYSFFSPIFQSLTPTPHFSNFPYFSGHPSSRTKFHVRCRRSASPGQTRPGVRRLLR